MHRPTSPHLQIYRLPLTAILSITHRMTSVVLSLGIVILIAILMVAATAPEDYAMVQETLSLWWGKGLLMLWTLALYFHLCHGIRHLLWDIDIGYSQTANNIGNALVIIGSMTLNALTWFMALML